ncbi:hypothetical protein [Alkaliphilus hydrothermalis]|uniref:Uncharacterized protein n=1 Tax=Alkaliphilus hydrothermalis TaxID=1482730 RepID=A0ABS2NR62_9FIRM|nr:hypothetical protein [Alkaliphilus hydrothermalis]MBM7615443.1 hypothetical protein [Alkaliphilus hydrothermalis]
MNKIKKKRMFNLLILSIVLSLVVLPNNVFANTNKTYSAFYLGEYGDYDAQRFVYHMDNLFYTRHSYKTTHNSSNRPTASDIINASNSAFLYLSGHGYSDTELTISNPIDGSTISSISAESNASMKDGSYYSTNEINTAKKDSYTTWSKWNTNLKWVFIAGCGQLNYGTQGRGNFYNNENTAQLWAKTMLGTNRVHGILGYYGSAPGDNNDSSIVNSFFNNATEISYYTGKPETILNSWKNANTSIVSITWASLVHRGNAGDYLPGFWTGLTANTTGAYTFDLYQKSGTSSAIPISLVSNDFSLASSSNQDLPTSIESEKTKFKLLNTYIPNNKSLKNLKVSPIDINRSAIAERLIGGTHDLRVERYDEEGNHIINNKNKEVKILKNGGLIFRDKSKSIEDAQKVSFNEEVAVEKAKQFLKVNGLLPRDAKVKDVYKVTRATMTSDREEFLEEEVMEYSVIFSHYYNGTEISSINGEGIIVEVGESGVNHLQFLWHDLEEFGESRNHINVEVALSKLKNQKNIKWNLPKEVAISNIELVYQSPDINDDNITNFKPAWKIEINNNIPILIDAVTGERL